MILVIIIVMTIVMVIIIMTITMTIITPVVTLSDQFYGHSNKDIGPGEKLCKPPSRCEAMQYLLKTDAKLSYMCWQASHAGIKIYHPCLYFKPQRCWPALL